MDMDTVSELQALRQDCLKHDEEFTEWLKQREEKEKNRPSIFTPKVVFMIGCFLVMVVSLFYKEFYLAHSSDDWRFFSAIHVITALICILGITIYNVRSQRAFDDDITQIDAYISATPYLPNERKKIYANDRGNYEYILDKFQEYIRIAKRLYFFGIITLATVFVIWDITQYFLAPNAYVVRLTSDMGWTTSAHQIYFLGLILGGGSVIISVMLRELAKAIAAYYTTIVHLGSLMSIIANSYSKSRSE
jgi:hypothetical protein